MTSNHRVYSFTASIFDIVSTVSASSHPLYWWYHTNCISEITSAIVHNIISIVYDMTDTVSHHNHCFHDIRFPTYHITSRIYDISPHIALTSQTLCLWMHVTIFNIKHMVLRQYNNIYEIKTSICLSVWSHTQYQCCNTHCIYDMGPTIFMEEYALCMTSHPQFMTSQHSIQYISLLYLISNWTYLTTHPLYLCHHTQIIDHITHIVCMITQAQYVLHHVNTYDITATLYDITPGYDILITCIHVITPRIPVTASTAAELLLTVYWL